MNHLPEPLPITTLCCQSIINSLVNRAGFCDYGILVYNPELIKIKV